MMHKWKWEGQRYDYLLGRVTHCSGVDRAVTMSVLRIILDGRGISLVHAEMITPLRWPRGLGYALALILACGLSVIFPWWLGASLLVALLLVQERP